MSGHAITGRTDRRKRRLSASVLLLVRAAGVPIMLGINAILARTVGVEGIGYLALVVSWTAIVALVVNAGLPTLLTREIAAAGEVKDMASIHGLMRWSLRFITILSVCVFLIGGAMLWAFWPGSEAGSETGSQTGTGALDSYFVVVIGVVALLPFTALLHWARGILSGFDRVVSGVLPEQFFRPVLFLVSLGIVVLLVELTIPITIGVYVMATALAALAASVLARAARPAGILQTKPRMQAKTWLWALVPLSGVAVTSVFKHQTDILMLGFLADASDVGFYRIASQVAVIPGVLMTVLNTVYAPKVAALHAGGTLLGAQPTLVGSARVMLAGALVAALIFLVIGEWLLMLLFGPEFSVSYPIALVLIAGTVVSAWCGQTATVLKMSDNAGIVFRVAIEGTVINITLNLILIWALGPIGAAVATALALVWVQLRQLRAIRSVLGMNISATARKVPQDPQREQAT
ncbi:oligosaccharide flippase family protein [Shimia ponticola]|uniref:oligosaccharide flippase family protein n=1 Tax=Shimia ponticola TaxID=2582893 RepID=UPI0011BDAEB0|nr:oligosaccharide flippase family protein [Shimia ponticola]